jgi:CBS domain-containing protein
MSGSLKWLRVHLQRTAHAGGATKLSRTVYCPAKGSYVSIEGCSACQRRFAVDRRDRDILLVCDVPDGTELPVAEIIQDATQARDGYEGGLVADAMASDVVCVEPELTLGEFLRVLLEHGISGAPVVDAGIPVGVVSKTDVVRALTVALEPQGRKLRVTGSGGESIELEPQLPAELASLRVREVMSPVVFTLPPDAPLERAAAMMAFEGIHRVPVVAEGRVVGLLTSLDVLRWFARRGGFVIPGHTARQ